MTRRIRNRVRLNCASRSQVRCLTTALSGLSLTIDRMIAAEIRDTNSAFSRNMHECFALQWRQSSRLASRKILRQEGGSRMEIEDLNLGTVLRTQVHDGDTNTC